MGVLCFQGLSPWPFVQSVCCRGLNEAANFLQRYDLCHGLNHALCCLLLAAAQGLGTDLACLPGCDGAVWLLDVREVRHLCSTPPKLQTLNQYSPHRVERPCGWPSAAMLLCGWWCWLPCTSCNIHATLPAAACIMAHLAAFSACLALSLLLGLQHEHDDRSTTPLPQHPVG